MAYEVDAFVRRNAHGLLRNSADVRPPEGVTDPNERNNRAADTTTIER